MESETVRAQKRAAARRRWGAMKDFLYGLTAHEFAQHAARMKNETETLFLLASMGDLAGLPVVPPIYSLRLLPYALPEITGWKRDLARVKELWEKEEFEWHGL